MGSILEALWPNESHQYQPDLLSAGMEAILKRVGVQYPCIFTFCYAAGDPRLIGLLVIVVWIIGND